MANLKDYSTWEEWWKAQQEEWREYEENLIPVAGDDNEEIILRAFRHSVMDYYRFSIWYDDLGVYEIHGKETVLHEYEYDHWLKYGYIW